MLTSWSCQGLLAHYCPQDPDRVILVDHTVPLSDPFYRQSVPLGNVEPLSIMQWNSSGTHLLLVHQSGSIEVFSQSVILLFLFLLLLYLYFIIALLLARSHESIRKRFQLRLKDIRFETNFGILV